MNNLTLKFPGCKLSNEELRETIRRIVGEEQFFCLKCFRIVPYDADKCEVCYQTYCNDCSPAFKTNNKIDFKKCLECEDNRKFLENKSNHFK